MKAFGQRFLRPLDHWLFTNAHVGWCAVFRALLVVLLAYAFWPSDLVPKPRVLSLPYASFLYSNIILGYPYQVAMGLIGISFGLGLTRGWSGFVLACMLVPHAFLNEGNQSRQVLVFVTFCTSLLPVVPLWRTGNPGRSGPIWPLRLIQLQLSVLYGVNALYKSTPSFLSGEVMMEISRLDRFHLDLSTGALDLGVLQVPVWVLGTGTVLVEGWLAVGFWFPRLRIPTALLGVSFHIGLTFVLTIFMLDLASCFLYLAFLLPIEHRPDRNA